MMPLWIMAPYGGNCVDKGTASTPSRNQCNRRRKPADHNCSPHTHEKFCNGKWLLHAAPATLRLISDLRLQIKEEFFMLPLATLFLTQIFELNRIGHILNLKSANLDLKTERRCIIIEADDDLGVSPKYDVVFDACLLAQCSSILNNTMLLLSAPAMPVSKPPLLQPEWAAPPWC